MIRARNWARLAIEKALELEGQSYTLGSTDCASVGMEVVRAMYEEDFFDGLTVTPIWPSMTLEDAADMLQELYATEIPVTFATCGDILLSKASHGDKEVVSVSTLLRGKVVCSHPDKGVYIEDFDRSKYLKAYRFENGI